MSEDLKEPTEVVDCEHERCVVVTLNMTCQFRENGEPEQTKNKDIAQVHGTDALEVFLDLLAAMQEATFEEATWVMEEFHLPPEIVAMAVRGIKIGVRVVDDE